MNEPTKFAIKAKNDPHIIKLSTMLETGVYAIDPKKYLAKLTNLHNTREIRALKSSNLLNSTNGGAKLTDALLENQSKRSRIVNIKKLCYELHAKLDEHIQDAVRYLQTRYSTELKSEYTVLKSRTEAARDVIKPAIRLQTQLGIIIKSSNDIIEDIDKAYWTMRTISEIMQQEKRKEL